MEYVQKDRAYYEEQLGYEITGAEIVGITAMNTGTAGLNNGVSMYRLEYRLNAADPDQVVLADGMTMEEGAITSGAAQDSPVCCSIGRIPGRKLLGSRCV